MKKLTSFCFIFLTLTSLTSCTFSDKPANFDYGVVENNQYKNKFFNFMINIPAEWKVQSKAQTQALADNATETGSKDEVLTSIIEAADISNATLLAVYKYDSGSMVAYNPNIMVVTENVDGVSAVKNGEDYLNSTKRLLKETKIPYKSIDDKITETQLGGAKFHTMKTTSSLMGIDINQRYFATIINGFSLIIVISYSTNDQLEELTNMLNTISIGSID
jgi:hypothetical protein